MLINNAGILRKQGIGDLSETVLSQQLLVNAVAPDCLAEASLPLLAKNAKLCFISSRMGSLADNTSGGHYGYRMSKAALNMGVVSLARDLRPRKCPSVFSIRDMFVPV